MPEQKKVEYLWKSEYVFSACFHDLAQEYLVFRLFTVCHRLIPCLAFHGILTRLSTCFLILLDSGEITCGDRLLRTIMHAVPVCFHWHAGDPRPQIKHGCYLTLGSYSFIGREGRELQCSQEKKE